MLAAGLMARCAGNASGAHHLLWCRNMRAAQRLDRVDKPLMQLRGPAQPLRPHCELAILRSGHCRNELTA